MRHRSPHAVTIRERHRRHQALVLGVLSKESVPPAEVEEAAQEVWLTIYQKLASGEPEPDSWPAYLTTLARGRAANHRRAAHHRHAASLADEPGAPAQRPSAEQVLVVYGLIDSIPSPDQREAALLRAQGYTIKEIAARQGITEARVKRRLEAAGEHLEKELKRDEDEDDKGKAGAFWGFGSFEKLLDALSEERERQWKNIEAAIQEIETPSGPPSSSGPKVAASMLPRAPNAAPGLVPAVTKVTLFAALGGALLGGAYLGARSGATHGAAAVVVCPEPPASPSVPAPSGSSLSSQAPSPAGTMAARPAASSPHTATPAARRPATAEELDGLLRREEEDRTDVLSPEAGESTHPRIR